jgi:homoserine kinase
VAGVRVRVPASSANLGPGFDSFAAALSLHLELTVRPAAAFAVVTDVDRVPRDRSNLVVRAFERLHPADGLEFEIRSAIPLTGGLGSSAAAIVAGLVAAQRLAGGGSGGDLLGPAGELEGHPDNVAAALYGGIVVCADDRAERFDPPAGLDALLVVPDAAVRTAAARAALPDVVPIGDAVFNTAHGALLMVGLVTGDARLVARGLADRLHQPRRAHLFPRSHELLDRAVGLGALGATISGAGPSVLVWCRVEQTAALRDRLEAEAAGWARVVAVGFAADGARATAI